MRFFVLVFLYFSNSSGNTVHIGSPSMKWRGQRYEPTKKFTTKLQLNPYQRRVWKWTATGCTILVVGNILLVGWRYEMSKFSTNWALYDPLMLKKTKKQKWIDMEIISDDVEKKLKLIEKAFRWNTISNAWVIDAR